MQEHYFLMHLICSHFSQLFVKQWKSFETAAHIFTNVYPSMTLPSPYMRWTWHSLVLLAREWYYGYQNSLSQEKDSPSVVQTQFYLYNELIGIFLKRGNFNFIDMFGSLEWTFEVTAFSIKVEHGSITVAAECV